MNRWGSTYSVHRSWLRSLGVALVALGIALFVPSFTDSHWAQFTSPAYHWVFTILPRATWGFVMTLSGALMVTASVLSHDDDWRYWVAQGLSVAIPLTWATAFLAAPLTGYNAGLVGAVMWSLLASWSVHVARHRG